MLSVNPKNSTKCVYCQSFQYHIFILGVALHESYLYNNKPLCYFLSVTSCFTSRAPLSLHSYDWLPILLHLLGLFVHTLNSLFESSVYCCICYCKSKYPSERRQGTPWLGSNVNMWKEIKKAPHTAQYLEIKTEGMSLMCCLCFLL